MCFKRIENRGIQVEKANLRTAAIPQLSLLPNRFHLTTGCRASQQSIRAFDRHAAQVVDMQTVCLLN